MPIPPEIAFRKQSGVCEYCRTGAAQEHQPPWAPGKVALQGGPEQEPLLLLALEGS